VATGQNPMKEEIGVRASTHTDIYAVVRKCVQDAGKKKLTHVSVPHDALQQPWFLQSSPGPHDVVRREFAVYVEQERVFNSDCLTEGDCHEAESINLRILPTALPSGPGSPQQRCTRWSRL
jgi:hypothetical protein